MRVRLYQNTKLSEKGGRQVWSLLKGTKLYGHVDGAVLMDCKFIVSEATRQYIINVRKKRTPCCYVEGEMIMSWPVGSLEENTSAGKIAPGSGARVRVKFNPYKMPFFTRWDCMQYVHESDIVVATPKGIFANLPACSKKGQLRGLPSGLSGVEDDWNGAGGWAGEDDWEDADA